VTKLQQHKCSKTDSDTQ